MASMSVRLPDDVKAFVYAVGLGHLRCDVCKVVWCKHIQHLVQTGSDAESLWERATQVDPMLPLVQVPIRPTADPEIWARVTVLPSSRGACRIQSHMTPNSESQIYMDDFMGFLNKGEGRIHLRQMVIDWFAPAMDLKLYSCQGLKHNFSADMELERIRESGTFEVQFNHCWHLYFSGHCAFCVKNKGSFDPDLVPGA